MEILSNPLRRYWRRRRYRRLYGSTAGKKSMKIVRFGGGVRRQSWKIRVMPKLRLIASPVKLWTKFKTAYMNMMLGLAGNVGSLNNDSAFSGKRIPKARQLPTPYTNAEFENRLIMEIYKALVVSRELATT